MLIYAMSDIHGEKEAFEDSLSLVDFSDPNTMLILCGDYLDRAHRHTEFLTYIREFQEAHEGQVIVLKGNHEADFYENECEAYDPIVLDDADEVFYMMAPANKTLLSDRKTYNWLSNLDLYYETDSQIFVHAGIDEEAGEYWKLGVEDHYFYSKFPATYGTSFFKDIIAGHVGASQMGEENRVFWDGESHFFIDGTTEESKFVPVLKYDTKTRQYTSFEKVNFATGDSRWSEYVVKPGCDEAQMPRCPCEVTAS